MPKIYVSMDDGTGKEYEVILTFKSETLGKSYVVYTDNQYDERGKLKVFAGTYDPVTNRYLESVKTSEEWIEIQKVLDKVI